MIGKLPSEIPTSEYSGRLCHLLHLSTWMFRFSTAQRISATSGHQKNENIHSLPPPTSQNEDQKCLKSWWRPLRFIREHEITNDSHQRLPIMWIRWTLRDLMDFRPIGIHFPSQLLNCVPRCPPRLFFPEKRQTNSHSIFDLLVPIADSRWTRTVSTEITQFSTSNYNVLTREDNLPERKKKVSVFSWAGRLPWIKKN